MRLCVFSVTSQGGGYSASVLLTWELKYKELLVHTHPVITVRHSGIETQTSQFSAPSLNHVLYMAQLISEFHTF